MFSVLGAGCSPEAVEWEVGGRRRTAPHQGYPPLAGKEDVGMYVCLGRGGGGGGGGRERRGKGGEEERRGEGGGKRGGAGGGGGKEKEKGGEGRRTNTTETQYKKEHM